MKGARMLIRVANNISKFPARKSPFQLTAKSPALYSNSSMCTMQLIGILLVPLDGIPVHPR